MEKPSLLEKLEQLPAPLKKEVEDFIDFLIYKKREESSIYFVEETGSDYNGTDAKAGKLKPKPVFGSGKGLFGKIADDFDAPLDEMKEYM
ncbi:MAG: DUF2281 domain-containing protein [Sphingobacteriaceae bacterium]|nr:MAG: DUF2281 domain-containing protein [Sphingobacteriaceae bacterium]